MLAPSPSIHPLRVIQAKLRMYRANPAHEMNLAEASVTMFETPTYQQAGLERWAEYIRNLITKYNEIAVTQLWNQDAELRESARVVAT